MAGPPPHGTSLGLWKCTKKFEEGADKWAFFRKMDVNKVTIVPVTDEQYEYLVVGTTYDTLFTQP